MKSFRITVCDVTGSDRCPMITIEDAEKTFIYSTIKNMYKDGIPGVGIQHNNLSNIDEISNKCKRIADSIFKILEE